MDHPLIRFRKAAARENRHRHTVRRRYSSAVQRQAVEYWRAREQEGDGMKDVAAALGIAPWSLHRWTRAHERDAQFHPVQIVDESPKGADRQIAVVMRSDGIRVEGLDVSAVAELLRLRR
jgi:hypothetical protein